MEGMASTVIAANPRDERGRERARARVGLGGGMRGGGSRWVGGARETRKQRNYANLRIILKIYFEYG